MVCKWMRANCKAMCAYTVVDSTLESLSTAVTHLSPAGSMPVTHFSGYSREYNIGSPLELPLGHYSSGCARLIGNTHPC